MKAASPWMKFYPQDWRADEKLRLCSLAARGLWIEMLALMHRSERYGQLLISGRVPTDAQLAVQAGAPPHEVPALLAELESAGVFSRAASGAIYSRRMTRDEKKARIARQNGKNGGNPSLCKSVENPASDKGKDKGSVKPHIPEARVSDDESSGARAPPVSPVAALFELGVSLLVEQHHSKEKARAMVGRWRKRAGDDRLRQIMMGALDKTDRLAWIEASVNGAAEHENAFYAAIDRKYPAAAGAQ